MHTYDENQLRQLRQHPVYELLSRAGHGEVIFPDEIDDLRLPDKQRKALAEAIERLTTHYTDGDGNPTRLLTSEHDKNRVQGMNILTNSAAAIVDSLDETWETRQQFEERRSVLGDAEAAANVDARRGWAAGVVDQIEKEGTL